MSKSAKESCPIAQASAIVGDMWNILIIRDLLNEPRRFTELQELAVSCKNNKCINTRTLADRLKELESDGILARAEFPGEMPPKVEYSLTKKGKALSKIIGDLKKFGETHLA